MKLPPGFSKEEQHVIEEFEDELHRIGDFRLLFPTPLYPSYKNLFQD
jgi:hypothetical protein